MTKPIFTKSNIGSTLAVASGLSFFFTCMLLSLVGRAGASVPYAKQNQESFLAAVCVTFLLAAAATGVKMMQRAEDKSPLPLWSMGLCAVCIALFVLQISGLLAI